MSLTDALLRRVLEQHSARLTQLPNVVGVGITDEAIAVYVRTQDQSDAIPATLEADIDEEHVEVPTRVIEIGEISR